MAEVKRIALSCWILWSLLLAVPVARAGTEGAPAERDHRLEAVFRQPPAQVRPRTWWHWMNGNISREGIKADLEVMAAAGLGGAQIFNVSVKMPLGEAPFGSEAWHGDVQYALQEAKRLGLTMEIMNCAGWSQSGGPWVPVEDSMKEFVWSELSVEGPKTVQVKLPMPLTRRDFYRESALLAVPADPPVDEPFEIKTSVAGARVDGLKDGDTKTSIALPKEGDWVSVAFAEPVERSMMELVIGSNGVAGQMTGSIQVGEGDGAFKTVKSFDLRASARGDEYLLMVPFAPTRAREFRMEFTLVEFNPKKDPSILLPGLLEVSTKRLYRVDNVEAKAARTFASTEVPALAEITADPMAIALERVLDLSGKLSADGTLAWEVPAGRWTVLRFGYTTTGATNGPAATGGEGLEVDKLDGAAVRRNLEHSLGRILRESSATSGTLNGILMDSWEAGGQTWTAQFPEQFRTLMGYDLRLWLPVLTGRVVGSPAEAEAFLRDYRRTIIQSIAENYYAEARRYAHEHKLLLYAEPYGSRSPLNYFRCGAEVDVNMDEFWSHWETRPDETENTKRRASLSHMLGRPVLAAEAFTGAVDYSKWQNTPGSLKRVGDVVYAQGLTQVMLHSYVHQPRAELKPGMTLGRYGTNFGRFDTWWPQARVWIDYLARCQAVLQQGQNVADLLLLRHDDMDQIIWDQFPGVPAGYGYDFIAPQQLLQAEAAAGGVRIATGAMYRAVVLPSIWVADIKLLEHMEKMKRAGVPIFGPAPVAPQGLRELREAGPQWRALVAQLWPADEAEATGAAKMDSDATAAALQRFLAEHKIGPDFRVEGAGADVVKFLHRRAEGAEIYFISHQSDQKSSVTLTLRGNGRALQPERWDPKSGRIEPLAVYSCANGQTSLSLSLQPADALFIVMRNPEPARHAVAVTLAGEAAWQGEQIQTTPAGAELTRAGEYQVELNTGERKTEKVDLPAPQAVTGPWQVEFVSPLAERFARTMTALQPWQESSDEALRYFSGTATYVTSFTLPAESLATGRRCRVELGQVFYLAEISVNGQSAGVVWTPPFSADITELLKPGVNTLALAVTNTWVNRLVGDERLPLDAEYHTTGSANTINGVKAFPAWWHDAALAKVRHRRTFSTWRHYRADSPLMAAGLAGPVTLQFSQEVRFAP